MIRTTLCLAAALTLAGCGLLRKTTAPPFDYVALPGGAFLMGDFAEGANEDALPLHRVVVAPFELSRHEITYAQYDAFAEATGRPLPPDDRYGRGNRAVVHVAWDDALAFCAYHGFRLPTEAEWEYAARSAGQPQRFAGADSLAGLDDVGRYIENSVMHSFPVGSKAPNSLGLYDMSGNVYEWIGDYYEYYPAAGSVPVYKDLEAFDMRILRGGSFKSDASLTQTFWRAGTLADITSDTIGFRCAR